MYEQIQSKKESEKQSRAANSGCALLAAAIPIVAFLGVLRIEQLYYILSGAVGMPAPFLRLLFSPVRNLTEHPQENIQSNV